MKRAPILVMSWLTSASVRVRRNNTTVLGQHEGSCLVKRGDVNSSHNRAETRDVSDLDELAALTRRQRRCWAQYCRHAGLVRHEVVAAQSLHWRRHGHRHRHHGPGTNHLWTLHGLFLYHQMNSHSLASPIICFVYPNFASFHNSNAPEEDWLYHFYWE